MTKDCCSPPTRASLKEQACQEASTHRKAVNHAGMVLIPAGAFRMGGADSEGYPQDGEGPVRTVTVSNFLIDATTVTNRRFASSCAAQDMSRTRSAMVGHTSSTRQCIRGRNIR